MTRSNPRASVCREAGAALLAFMLVVVVGASFILVSSLNANVRQYVRKEASTRALSEAKAALIGYAINYPETHPGEGPGYLPCPDISNNGSAGGSCSLAGGTTIGRLPWKTLETTELRDEVGERLWYAVSDNYKNNPKNLPRLNSEAPGNFTVDGRSDIVAVIFAPGPPVASQDRAAAPLDVTNYLEDDNANGDTYFVSRGPGEFNDQLVLITRAELMGIVEQRVINQIRTVLKKYYGTYGAYPWMTPFADPKASFQGLRGTHNGGDNSTTLDDSTENFNDWGVQPGDTVINVTDGSMGAVSAVSANSLSVSSLLLGTDNDFDNGDVYAVITRSNSGLLTGLATSGSSGLTLNDSGKDFDQVGISTGDIVEDITDGSSGMVNAVSSTQLTVESLTGGTNNAFAAGDSYQIRSNRGVATSGSSGLALEDTGKDFSAMGLKAGDLVVDITDGSSGRVSAVTATTLTLDSMYHGTNNAFSSGDYYYIPRFNTDDATREGLLSFHEAGKDFSTGFTMDWDITQANGATYALGSAATYLQSQYTSALQNFAEASGGTTGTITVAPTDGSCIWVVEQVVDCRGIYKDKLVEGVTTSGSNTTILTDSNAAFTTEGIKRGDVVDNYDDETSAVYGTATAGSSGTTLVDTGTNFSGLVQYNYLINNYTQATNLGISKVEGVVTRIMDTNTIEVSPFPNEPAIQFNPGDSYAILKPDRTVITFVYSATQANTRQLSTALSGGSPDLDAGEYYRIRPAASRFSGQATSQCCGHTAFRDTGVNFSGMGVKVGDVVHNLTDASYGLITSISGDWIYMTSGMYGGTNNNWDTNDNFEIFYNYVNARGYDLQPRFSGTTRVYGQGGLRKRDGCIGYADGSGNPDCSTTATPQSAALQANGTTPMVTIRDYDDSGNVIASATVTVPTAGTANGSMKVSGLDYYLRVAGDELPEWFVDNNWQRLLYTAYSSDYVPGGSGSCTPGTDCLYIQGRMSANDRQAVVLSAGRELSSVTCPDASYQNRTRGRVCDYYESDNASSGDDIFRKEKTDTFNDRIITVNP
jgi:hypothetical protein